MNYLKNCNYFTTILFVIIALLLSPCYLIEYEEIYTYNVNNSESAELIIDRFPDETVLIADDIGGRLNISLLHPNRTMKFMNIIPCSTDQCDIDKIIPLKQNIILIIYESYQANNGRFLYQYSVDWLGNIISDEILYNESAIPSDIGHYLFIKNTFYEDKYFFIIFKDNYFSYIEYKVM